MNPAPPTLEEVQKKRISELLKTCVDMSFGSVWCIQETVWIKTFLKEGQRYDENSKRKWHPGVSLRTTPLTSVYEYIPMLHGSSGDHGPVIVRGLTPNVDADYATSFGRIVRPAKVAVTDATSSAPTVCKEHLVGRMIDRSMVSANLHKPRLNEAELEDLRLWAKNRNLI